MPKHVKLADPKDHMESEAVDRKLENEIKEWEKLGMQPEYLEMLLNKMHEDTRLSLTMTLLREHLGMTEDQFLVKFKETLLDKFTEVRLEQTPRIEEARIKAQMSVPENKLLGPNGEVIE